MTQVPQFNLSDSTMAFDNDDVLDQELAKEGKSRFEEGHYELKVNKAYFTEAANDPTWFKVRLELGTGIEGDDRTLKHTIMLPTTLNIYYQKPGGKKTLFVYKQMFAPFFKAIGEAPSQSTLRSILEKYTGKLSPVEAEVFEDGQVNVKEVMQLDNLVGKTVEVDIGYEGAYIKRVNDETLGVYKNGALVTVEEKELVGPSFEDVEALAVEHNIQITRLGITKFYEQEAVAQVTAFDAL